MQEQHPGFVCCCMEVKNTFIASGTQASGAKKHTLEEGA
jgi:hypothetical protein